MTSKYQRPAGAFTGASGLNNRTKYQDDATAVPKRAISSSKIDGDLNYLVDALNQIDEASGVRTSINERLSVALNPDGTLKSSVTANLDDFVIHTSPGTLARVDNSTFTLSGGDYRSLYVLNRRIRLTIGGAGLTGDVTACTYSGSLTTVTVSDLVDSAGVSALISLAPTQVAYGPLVPGAYGNVPRRTDSLKIPAGATDYQLVTDTTDLLVKRSGSVVARVSSAGISGLAAGSVGVLALASDALAVVVPAGAVMPFAGGSAPSGWLFCAGQAISRTTYAALFTAIGTTYGAGDGTTTFTLPDLRGRAVFGLDNMGGTTASRVTSGVSGITGTTLGANGGSQLMHQHNHAVTDPGHIHSIGISTGGLNATTGNYISERVGGQIGTNTSLVYQATLSGLSSTTGLTVNNAGSGGSQNMPPAMMLNYIIKV